MSRKIDPPPSNPTLLLERHFWEAGFERVCGIDEAGRGALAGPVCAAAVILPRSRGVARTLDGVRDSKQMTPLQRERWAAVIRETALAWGVGFASAQEIDEMGILPATRLAARRAVAALSSPPDMVITDYLDLPLLNLPQEKYVKGDQRSLSIAAASVLAKTSRDAWMREIDAVYPRYGFARHKGYGTQMHREAVAAWGRTPIHRKTFFFRALLDKKESSR